MFLLSVSFLSHVRVNWRPLLFLKYRYSYISTVSDPNGLRWDWWYLTERLAECGPGPQPHVPETWLATSVCSLPCPWLRPQEWAQHSRAWGALKPYPLSHSSPHTTCVPTVGSSPGPHITVSCHVSSVPVGLCRGRFQWVQASYPENVARCWRDPTAPNVQ